MSSRKNYDPNDLLQAEKFLTAPLAELVQPQEAEPPKGKAPKASKKASKATKNLCIRTTPAFAKKLRVAATQRETSVRAIIMAALKEAGFEE